MLPTKKSEPFNGNIKRSSRFWVQSEYSVNKNLPVSNISKHVFLCGYLDDESKRLLDGASVSEETYEKRRKFFRPGMGTRTELSMLTWIIQKIYSLPNRTVVVHLISLRQMSSSDSSYKGPGEKHRRLRTRVSNRNSVRFFS